MKRPQRQFVRERAGRRCEYCHIPDAALPAASFHVEHILAKQHWLGAILLGQTATGQRLPCSTLIIPSGYSSARS